MQNYNAKTSLFYKSLCFIFFAAVCDTDTSGREVPLHVSWTENPATTLTFAWERDNAGRGTIQYGLTTNYTHSARDSGGFRRHAITLKNLTPGSTYHYRASSTDGFESDNHTIRTAPNPTGSVHLVVYGDNQRGSDSQSDHRGVVGQIMTDPPDLVLGVGDMADEAGYPGFEVWEEYFVAATSLLEEVVFMPVVGNHENPNSANAYYWRIFYLPERPASERFYSYDVGNMHFIALNSENNITGQTNWLSRDLQAASNNTNTDWVFVYFHRPPYTKGSHGSDENIKTNWCPLFVQYEVDMVFNGHNHSYERTVPIRGVVYVVTGGGGASLYSFTPDLGIHASATSCYHHVSMKVSGSFIDYEAIRSDGLVFDSLSLTNTGKFVQFAPAFPVRNETVKISYRAEDGPIAYSSPVYIHVGTDFWTNIIDTAMAYNSETGVWEFDYTVPSGALSRVVCCFHDNAGTNWDNNYDYNWQALLDRVKFVPALPTAGSNVLVQYDKAIGTLSASTQIFAHIGFNNWEHQLGSDLPLTNNLLSTMWETIVELPLYADQMNVVFNDGTDWDNNDLHNWKVAISGATPPPPWSPLPVVVAGTPDISTNPPVVENNAGDNFDLNQSGTALLKKAEASGFGDFGRTYFNHDATNLYIGGVGANLGGTNNVFILFLGFDTMTNSAENLWHKSGLPNTLDFLHNVGFTEPMDIAIVYGDEHGDMADNTNFTYAGYNFGQGIYKTGTDTSFFDPVEGARLSQFDGIGSTPCAGGDDDGNRQTDRWEASIPWNSIDATGGVASVDWVLAAGLIASDSVSGNNRYLSGSFIGRKAFGEKDTYGNYSYNFVDIVPEKILLSGGDYDADGLPNLWEHTSFGSAQGPLPTDDTDNDGFNNQGEFIAGTDPTNSASLLSLITESNVPGSFSIAWPGASNRIYLLSRSTNLLSGFDLIETNIAATPPLNSYTDNVGNLERAFYTIEVQH